MNGGDSSEMNVNRLSGERLLSRQEVEEIFGFPSKRFLELAVIKGNGPPIVRFGRTVRYRLTDLRNWISQHETRVEIHCEEGANSNLGA